MKGTFCPAKNNSYTFYFSALHQLLYTALKVLCPDNKPKSPVAVEIVRNVFSFLVRNRLFKEALEFSSSAVAICLASQLEGSAFKILAAVTVIQLAQGDAVKVSVFCILLHLVGSHNLPPQFISVDGYNFVIIYFWTYMLFTYFT